MRTQTVAIMRDALYRICEAYNNGLLTEATVANLLSRSQDLTVAILAIDQLTSVVDSVKGRSVTGGAALLSGRLATHAELLLPARGTEAARRDALNRATEAWAAAASRYADAAKAAHEAKAAHDKALEGDKDSKQEKTQELKELLDQAASRRDDAQKRAVESETAVATAKQDLSVAEGVTATLETAYKGALSTTVTDAMEADRVQATGSPEFASQVTKEIADAVQSIVRQVFGKDYLVEACSALLLSNQASGRSRDVCQELIIKRSAEALLTSTAYAPDSASELLEDALRDDLDMRGRLRDWLQQESAGILVTEFVYGDFPGLREKAIRDLGLGVGDSESQSDADGGGRVEQ